MSKIVYRFHKGAPPAVDVYTTRRNESKYHTLRYWDGKRWYSLDCGPSRGGKPFVWPKKSRSRRPPWVRRYEKTLCLRNISPAQAQCIEWGVAYKTYDASEVLAYLVKNKVLRPDWATYYQALMRGENVK